ncbi:MAG: hypothetical protein ACXACI_04255 [Candidatus Hodarchaeales archaeon]
MHIRLRRSKYWQTTISADKRAYFPKSTVEMHNIQKDELYEVELKVESQIFKEIVIVSITDRSEDENRADDYYFMIRLQDVPTATAAKARIVKKIPRIVPDAEESTEEQIYLPNLFPEAIMGKKDRQSMIIFLGRHVPIITPIRIALPDIIHYFGCYYADGTKRDHAWSINASTPEQAMYYIKNYNSLNLQPKLAFQLTFTYKGRSRGESADLRRKLRKAWQSKANVHLNEKDIFLRESSSKGKFEGEKHHLKHNPLGSLRIRDYRGLIMKLHLRLLRKVQSFVLRASNTYYSWSFLLGIMEGDGSVGGGRDRCRLKITCLEVDEIIPELLANVGINPLKEAYQKPSNAVDYSFGIVPILKNLTILEEELFRYYPKRRKVFIERLLKLATVQFLLKETDELFPLALHPLKENYILDDEKIIVTLIKMRKELTKNISAP